MTPERWRKLDELFHAALERGTERRAAFLAEACDGDDELRHELESMLAHHEQAENFIERPAYAVAAETVVDDDPSEELVGKALGPYRVISLLGEGGMGLVYLAFDEALQRKVALKFLPPEFTSDKRRVQRFRLEARATSALNHPNILTVHEIGETDGRHFIVTEFVEGETLRRLVGRGRSRVSEVLDLAVQLTSALSAAHAAGIVHRDIKPENIMVRPDGYVKVVDFGIAKLTESAASLSYTGTVVTTETGAAGTVHYMSPEQARGLDTDGRTDLWSLGVVLYEMLAGRTPFSGTTQSQIVTSILENEPQPLTHNFPEVPAELEWIIAHALRKDREERYQTAKELLAALKSLQRRLESAARLESIGGPWRGRGTPLTAGGGRRTESAGRLENISPDATRAASASGRRRTRKAIDSLAILPLDNESADANAEYLSDGITESIINNLSQLPRLRVMSRSTVFRYKGWEVDPLEVGRELNVRAVLTGRVLERGDRFLIGTELVDVSDGSQLWGGQYNCGLSDIISVQGEIAKQISENLRMRLSSEEKKRLNKRYTENTEAYQLYLKGRYCWNKRRQPEIEKGIEYFHRAVEADPNYALAYAGVADSHIILGFYGLLAPGEAMPKAKAAAEKALEIDDTLAEAHVSMAYVKGAYDWDWAGAERLFKRAIELNKNYATAHHWYGEYLAEMGRFDEAQEEIKQAHALDPLSLIINEAVGWIFYLSRQYDQAIKQYLRTLELDQKFVPARFCLGLAYVQKGMLEEAINEFKTSIKILGRNPGVVAALGHTYGLLGRRSEAQKQLDDLSERSMRKYVAPYLIAGIYTGLGEKDQALEWLQRGYEERDVGLVWLNVIPMADRLRSDPRFQELLRRLGFPP
jgi:serine/threonine-protein kinase